MRAQVDVGCLARSLGRALVATLPWLLPATPAAFASNTPQWSDGVIAWTQHLNCITNQAEFETGQYVGYFGNSDVTYPQVGDVYYGHIVVSTVGNACAGTYAHIEVIPPPATQIAISAQNPVYCFATNPQGVTTRIVTECPQSLGTGVYGRTVDATTGPWPLPVGWTIEVQIPLRSSQRLSGIATSSYLQAAVRAIDGVGNPWAFPSQGVFVADPLASVVWSSNNVAQLWHLNGGAFAGMAGFAGPGPGWTLASHVRLRDGSGGHHLLWTRSGQAQLWRINANGTFGGMTGFGGPGSGWTVTNYFLNGDNSYHLLWSSGNQAQVWTINANNTWGGGFGLGGPGAGWTATGYVRHIDGSHRILWTADGLAQLWTITAGLGWGGMTGLAGPGSGWTATDYHLNGDGSWNVVWAADNVAQIWSITAAGGWGGMQGLGGPGSSWTLRSYFR